MRRGSELARSRRPREGRAHRESVLRELELIASKNRGRLLPKDIVAFAKNPNTALHSDFEWNDGLAAMEWRIEQARRIIRINIELLPGTVTPMQTFVSLAADRRGEGGYRDAKTVMGDSELRAMLVADALAEMEYFERKYRMLSELAEIFEAMDRVSARLRSKHRPKTKAPNPRESRPDPDQHRV